MHPRHGTINNHLEQHIDQSQIHQIYFQPELCPAAKNLNLFIQCVFKFSFKVREHHAKIAQE